MISDAAQALRQLDPLQAPGVSEHTRPQGQGPLRHGDLLQQHPVQVQVPVGKVTTPPVREAQPPVQIVDVESGSSLAPIAESTITKAGNAAGDRHPAQTAAVVEGLLPDGSNTIRNRQLREAVAAIKSSLPDTGDALRDTQAREAAAAPKCILRDDGEPRRQLQSAPQAAAASEGVISDAGDGSGDLQPGEVLAIIKGIAADAGQPLGKLQFGDGIPILVPGGSASLKRISGSPIVHFPAAVDLEQAVFIIGPVQIRAAAAGGHRVSLRSRGRDVEDAVPYKGFRPRPPL